MSACPQVVGDPDSIYPVPTGRIPPGVTRWHHHDLSSLDCAGTGVTIVGVIASINADDDDGLLTVGTTTVDADGLGWSQLYTADADESQRIYSVQFNITTSDGQLLKRYEQVSVIPTRRPWA